MEIEGRLPAELLVLVFQHLDPGTLVSVRCTCRAWCSLVTHSVLLWKHRIEQHCLSSPADRPLLSLPLYKDMARDAVRLQAFHRRLARLQSNIQRGRYSVRRINCLEAELGGRRVVRSEEWESTRNYRGVYDMILDNNRLIASVYDTIQVWDLHTYTITSLLNPKSLGLEVAQSRLEVKARDSPHAATTCFAVLGDKLVCGTQSGDIKLILLSTGEVVCQVRRSQTYISDVCVRGETVEAVDWYGAVAVYSHQGNTLTDITGDGWEVPRLLAGREVERLLDFTPEFTVTTYKSHLTCYRKGEFYRSYPAHSDIFCLSIVGRTVAFGCKGDGGPVAGLMALGQGPPQVIYLRTPDNDPVISLHLTPSLLVLGDVNGELHRVQVGGIKFPESGEVTVELARGGEEKGGGGGEGEGGEGAGEAEGGAVGGGEGGVGGGGGEVAEFAHGVSLLGTLRTHEYRDFVWAVKGDSYRLLSGDETGKIVVHDFLMLDDWSCSLCHLGFASYTQVVEHVDVEHNVREVGAHRVVVPPGGCLPPLDHRS